MATPRQPVGRRTFLQGGRHRGAHALIRPPAIPELQRGGIASPAPTSMKDVSLLNQLEVPKN